MYQIDKENQSSNIRFPVRIKIKLPLGTSVFYMITFFIYDKKLIMCLMSDATYYSECM